MDEPSDEDFDQGDDYASLGRPGETFWSKYGASVFGTLGSLAVSGMAFGAGYDPHGHFPAFAKVVVGLGAVSALVFGYFAARKLVTESTLGGVDVTWEPHKLQTDRDLSVDVRFEPKSSGELNTCDLTLHGFYNKEIHDPDGGNHETRVDVYEHTERIPESSNRSFTGGELVQLAADLSVPAHDELDGNGPYNWELSVHLDIATFPDWTDTFRLDG
jgi:hypothetical protein